MKFTITLTEANRLEGLVAMVAKASPNLQKVLVKFEAHPTTPTAVILSVTGTDSYRAARQFLGVGSSDLDPATLSDSVQVEAVTLLAALKKMRAKTHLIELEFEAERLVATNILQDGSATIDRVLLKTDGTQFPKGIDGLLAEVDWDADGESTEAMSFTGLSPVFMAEIPKIIGAHIVKPKLIRVELKVRGENKPIGFRAKVDRDLPHNVGLLMPYKG